MFCKSNGHKMYSSSPELGKCNYIIVIFLQENSYILFRTGFTISSCISTLKCSPMTHFLFIIVKLQVTWPLNYIFIKKSVLVSNIIIMIPKTFRFWFQPLILIEIGIFSHSKSSVRVVWHRLRQFKLKSDLIIIIPASKNICLIKK